MERQGFIAGRPPSYTEHPQHTYPPTSSYDDPFVNVQPSPGPERSRSPRRPVEYETVPTSVQNSPETALRRDGYGYEPYGLESTYVPSTRELLPPKSEL